MPSSRKRPFMSEEFFDNILRIESDHQQGNTLGDALPLTPLGDASSPSPCSTTSDQYFLSAPHGQQQQSGQKTSRRQTGNVHVYSIDVDQLPQLGTTGADASPMSQGSTMAFGIELDSPPHDQLPSDDRTNRSNATHIPPIPSYLTHCTVEFLRLSWIGSRFGSRIFPHRLESEFAISEPHYQMFIKDISRVYDQEYYSKWSRHKLLTRILYVITLMVAAMFVVGHILVVILDQFGIFDANIMNPSLLYLLIMPVHLVWLLLLGVILTWRTLYPAFNKTKKGLILRASRSMIPLLERANSKEGIFQGRLRLEMHLKRSGGGIVGGLFHGSYHPYLMIYRPPRTLMQYELEDRAREYVKDMLHDAEV